MDKSITLPPDEIFRNLENAKRFAIDIGSRGRAPGAGRRAAGVGAGGGAGGPGAVARTKGGARAADAHILSDLVVRCPPAPVLAAAVGLPLPAGAARPERGMPGLVVPRGEAGGRAAPRWSTSVGSATGRGLCGPREGRGARGVGPRRGVQASGRGNPRRAARPGPSPKPSRCSLCFWTTDIWREFGGPGCGPWGPCWQPSKAFLCRASLRGAPRSPPSLCLTLLHQSRPRPLSRTGPTPPSSPLSQMRTLRAER